MWCDKYRPLVWSDFVGNDAGVARCKRWLTSYPGTSSIPDRVLLISGPEGCGKTSAAMMLLSGSYKIYRFTLQDIRNHKKDTELFSNFQHLYMSNLRHTTGGRPHAIVIDDFESLTKADKAFHTLLIDLVKAGGAHSPPLILTITTMTSVSAKHRTESYQGLAKLSTEVTFSSIRSSDMEILISNVSRSEKVSLDTKVACLIADYSQGDARKALLTLELLSRGKTRVTNDLTLDWVDQNSAENDEKTVYDTEDAPAMPDGTPDTQSTASKRRALASGGGSTDEDRILEGAFVSSDRKVIDSASNLIVANSMQFTPLLFQLYPSLSTMSSATLISEEFSLADTVRENSWMGGQCSIGGEGGDDEPSLSTSFSVEFPMRRINALKGLRGSKRPIRTFGYQAFYGFENTSRSQSTAARTIRGLHPDLRHTSDEGLLVLQRVVANWLDTISDDSVIVSNLRVYDLHPDHLDSLAKLKGNSDVDLVVSRARKRNLIALYEQLIEKESCIPTVKFLEPAAVVKKPSGDPNNMFCLQW